MNMADHPQPSVALIRAIQATIELVGAPMSEAAAELFVDDVSGYPEAQVLHALARCRKEVRGRLTVRDVIDRLPDGRPSADEAWSQIPKDDCGSVVWTDEMAMAWEIARPAWEAHDRAGAARAFREAYVQAVSLARDARKPANWTVSLGDDKTLAYRAIEVAVRNGQLSLDAALTVAPDMQGIDAHQNLIAIASGRRVGGPLLGSSEEVQRLALSAVSTRRA